MPAPTPVAETYTANINTVTTFAGTVQAVISGNWTVETMTDEMTNTSDGGWKSQVPCINSASGSMTIAGKSGSPPLYVSGLIYPIIINDPVCYLAGNVRVTKFDFAGQDVKAGTKYTLSWISEGQMTSSSSSQVTPP